MEVFIEIGSIIFVATIVSIIMRLLKQPLIVGYILTGIVVGPYFLNIAQSTQYIELFSKLGIAILLFIIGLSLKPDIVREVGKVATITGFGQIILTSVLGFFVMKILGFNSTTSFYGAIALTFSSTITVLKLLSDKYDLSKLYGKVSIGILLIQDVVATFVLLFVSILGSFYSIGGSAIVYAIFMFIKGFLFFFVIYLITKYILPKVSYFLASSQEMLFLFSITWGLGLSAIFYKFGFSLEIGALAAGVALSSSVFSQEISSRMKPLRDFFILIFFIMLGSQMVFSSSGNTVLLAVILSAFVLFVKPLVVIFLMNLQGYRSRVNFLTGMTMSQVSEFSLILLTLALSFERISRESVSLITLASLISIAGSSYLILYADNIYPYVRRIVRFFEIKKNTLEVEKEETKDVEMIIFGYDRVGYDFVSVAQKMKKNYLVVDFDPMSVDKLQKNDIPFKFGDAQDVDFLEEIGVRSAKIIVSTVPGFKTNLGLVSYYRLHNPNGIIVVISHNIKNTQELYKAGASFVVMPHYLGARHAAKMIEHYGEKSEEFERERAQHLEDLRKRLEITGEK